MEVRMKQFTLLFWDLDISYTSLLNKTTGYFEEIKKKF